jgi:hypothetical protein
MFKYPENYDIRQLVGHGFARYHRGSVAKGAPKGQMLRRRQ